MKVQSTNSPSPSATQATDASNNHTQEELQGLDTEALTQLLLEELQAEIRSASWNVHVQAVATRLALEVERICQKSSRIQTSGQVRSWQISLGRHRLEKCLNYYRLGSKRGRVELHSHLSSIVYRYVSAPQSQLGFQARYNLIEDFLQEFYAESLKAFRRENQLPEDYTPRTQLQLAEYMAFTEQYAKRRINLPKGASQQLIVLRAQGFARRQPAETPLDIEGAVEFPKEDDSYSRSPAMQQVRSQMVAETVDPADAVLRERVILELVEYLESQNQSDCIDYLVLKLQDLSAPEIDSILGLSPRQRDYLQQRFKYHVEKFARTSNWKLVHQWLGADLDQKLGMNSQQWEGFWNQLSSQQQQLFQLKQNQASDQQIAQRLDLTPKQVQKRWTQMLELAWKFRNQEEQGEV